MTESEVLRTVVGIVRRQWWIVVLVVVVALGAAVAVNQGATTVYTGRSALIYTSPVVRYQGFVYPDHHLRNVKSQPVLERLSEATGLEVSEVSSGLRMSTGPDPVNTLFVNYESSDPDTAEVVAGQIAEELIEYGRDEVSGTLAKLQTQADEANAAIAELEDIMLDEVLTPAERASTRFALWTMKDQLAEIDRAWSVLYYAYSWDGTVDVSSKTQSQLQQSTLVGAGFIGLALGVALAAVRERYAMRREAAEETGAASAEGSA